jgi:hypothetical protein
MDALPLSKSHENKKRSSLRIVSDLTKAEVQIIANEFAIGLQRILTESVGSLKESFAAMDKKMEEKSEDYKRNAASKFSICQEMKCGTIEDFHRGLVGRIGNS